MMKVGLLSDTHAWWDEKYLEYFDRLARKRQEEPYYPLRR